MSKGSSDPDRKLRRALGDPSRFLPQMITLGKTPRAEDILAEVEALFDSGERAEAAEMLLRERKKIRRELKSAKQTRCDFRMTFARVSAKIAKASADLNPTSIDSFCLEIYRDLQNLIDWFEENSTQTRLREVKSHVKEFFAHWSLYYIQIPDFEDAERVFNIQILSDLVTQKHKHPAYRAKANKLIAIARNALKSGRFRRASELPMPDCSGILKIFRCATMTFGVFKRPGEPAALFRLTEMAKASDLARARTQLVLQENLQGVKKLWFPEIEEDLRTVADTALWSPLEKLHQGSAKPIVVLRESALHDFLLYPRPLDVQFRQYKNFLILALLDELKSKRHSGIDVVVGDQNRDRNPIVTREVWELINTLDMAYSVGHAEQLAELADLQIRRLYAVGHSYAPAEYDERNEDHWPLVQIGKSFVDLHSLNAVEVFANGCDLGSAFRGEDGLWTSLPDTFILRGAHTVIAPVIVTSQFWALGLMYATREFERMGYTLVESFEYARAMILSGKWTNWFIKFMDQQIEPFLKDMARERAKTVSRELDPLAALSEFAPADLVEWHTRRDVYLFGKLIQELPDHDPVELAEKYFFECGMRIWQEVRTAQKPQPFASMILSAGYRVWGGL